MLHDPSSQMMDMLIYSLKEGKLCIIDVSQLRGEPALILSGLILQKIFDHNQQEFTEANPKTIPTIAVVEEAQSVLGSKGGSRPYVEWVKEGRKYDLGAVLITQQPGSIAGEILSQGDNWFVFHLLSSYDLQALKKANAHFSDDLLSTLLNEPLVGNGVFWSSASGQSYPIPIRILSFEQQYKARDPEYNMPSGNTYTKKLREIFKIPPKKIAPQKSVEITEKIPEEMPINGEVKEDLLNGYISEAIETLTTNHELINKIRHKGVPWRGVVEALENALPSFIDIRERNKIAYANVRPALDKIFGEGNWENDRRPKASGTGTTVWVVMKKNQ
jgi:uncharacterized protein